MVENGTKVSIEISEPWDAYKVLIGTIIRSINGDDYFLIQDNKSKELYIVTNRYEGDKLSDIVKGEEVTVGIATLHQSLDMMNIPEINQDTYQWLNYVYIGVLKLKIDA